MFEFPDRCLWPLKRCAERILPAGIYLGAQRWYWKLKGEYYEPETFARRLLRGKKRPTEGDIRVSILCNVWNTPPDFLSQTVESVLNQNYRNWEFLVNNCSDADDFRVNECLKHCGDDPRVRMFRTENRGIANNSNYLISQATGEFVLLLDHDDVLLPDALAVMMEAQKKENSDFVYADEIVLFMSVRHLLRTHKKPFSMSALEKENFINHPALIRKTLLEKVDGFREGFEGSQDHDLYLRLCEKTDKIAYVPRPLYVWRLSGGNFSANNLEKCIDSGRRAVQEHLDRMNIRGKVIADQKLAVFTISRDPE